MRGEELLAERRRGFALPGARERLDAQHRHLLTKLTTRKFLLVSREQPERLLAATAANGRTSLVEQRDLLAQITAARRGRWCTRRLRDRFGSGRDGCGGLDGRRGLRLRGSRWLDLRRHDGRRHLGRA